VAATAPAREQERDLLLAPFYEGDDASALDVVLDPPVALPGDTVDLAVAAQGNALRQAILLRLLTPQGALADLGHAEYGSRLHELIGSLATEETRRLARSFVLQAIAQERRVERVLELEVARPDQLSQDRLRIFLRVQPATRLDPVALGIEVAL
jgi:phage baseplate assembly protein W